MGNFLTQNLFLPIARRRRKRRAEMREVFKFYEEGMNFRRASVNWSVEQKRDWILEKLRFSVRRAARETVYYRELFEKINFDAERDFNFDDFAKLPVLERENIHDAGDDLISSSIPKENLVKDATGGSTGTPTQIWLGAEEIGWKESGVDFALEKIGVPAGSRTAYFWGHHLDPQAGESLKEKFKSFAANERYFDCFRLSPEIFEKYHREFEKYAPDCIIAYASALGQFAEYLREKNIKPKNYPKKCFVTGAEKLYVNHRAAIEEVFGKPVHERYGGRDFGGAAIQVNPSENLFYEIDWAWSLVEPENDDENSSILVTKLHADGMPLIRYRVGDIAEFAANSKTGFPAFQLNKVIGRDLDRIWLDGEKWIHAIEIPHLLKDFSLREFVLIQSEDYSVELQVVPKNGFNAENAREIEKIITANLGNLPFNLKKVDEIQRTKANKWRPVISKVKK